MTEEQPYSPFGRDPRTTKLTDAELVAMTQQYTQDRDGEFVTHVAYREMNRQIAEEGRQWCKCANCGNPYPLSDEWGDMTVCSSGCWADYASYLDDYKSHLGGWIDEDYGYDE